MNLKAECAAIWMDPGIIILNEASQKEKDKIPYDITYMHNLKNKTNGCIQQE